MLFVDHYFFDMFSFELIAGNPKTALTEINNVVLPKLLLEQYLNDDFLKLKKPVKLLKYLNFEIKLKIELK